MARLSHSLEIYSDGQVREAQTEIPPQPVQFWRVPHDLERLNTHISDLRYGGDGFRGGKVRRVVLEAGVARPEVYRVYPDQTTPIGEPFQWLWKNINPELSGSKWATLLGNTLAWTNGTGFPGHRDFVNNRDADKDLPRFHAPLVNGGQVLEGIERDGKVWIKSLLIGGSVPAAGDVLGDPTLWSWGTSVNPRGEINLITRLGRDYTYKPVRILFLTKFPVWLPANELDKLPLGAPIPDARQLS